MKTKKTKQKFYNKWLYKVTLAIKDITDLRYKNYDHIIGCKNEYNDELIELCSFLRDISKDDYNIRIERTRIDFYTNDCIKFHELQTNLKNFVVHCYAPEDSKLISLEKPRTIVVNKLPYDRYKYKVFLHPHKVKDKEVKKRYIKWLESQGNKINISNNVKNWFVITQWNWDRRYMYVDTEQTLLLLKMKDPEAIGSVYTYAIHDK